MKLNEEICKRCHIVNYGGWSERDDAYWHELSEIGCPEEKYMLSIHHGPSKNCAYKLEHLVMNESRYEIVQEVR